MFQQPKLRSRPPDDPLSLSSLSLSLSLSLGLSLSLFLSTSDKSRDRCFYRNQKGLCRTHGEARYHLNYPLLDKCQIPPAVESWGANMPKAPPPKAKINTIPSIFHETSKCQSVMQSQK